MIHMKELSNFSAYNLLPGILTLSLTGILCLLTYYRVELNPEILDTHIRALNLHSAKYQRLVYVLTLISFAGACASILLVREPFEGSGDWNREKFYEFYEFYLAMVVVFTLLFWGTWEKDQGVGFGFGVLGFIAYTWNKTFRELLKKILNLCRSHGKLLRSVSWLAIIFLVVSFWILPLFQPMFVESLNELRWIDGHYAVTVLSGLDLVLSDDLQVKRATYGLGMPLLIATVYKASDYVRISGVELPHAVKFYQVFALLLIGSILFILNRRNLILGFLLTICLTLYTLSNVGTTIGYPNQSGIRYTPILLGLLVCALELKRQNPRVSILAITSATVVTFSPETGFALTAGLIVAAILIEYKSSTRLSSISLTLAKFLPIFCLTFFLFFYLIVRPLLKKSGANNFEFLWLFGGSDYGEIVNRLSLSAGLIFFIATTTVLRIVVKARNGDLLKTDVWQAAIATVMLVWFFYYVHRAAEVNLWFQWVLLILLFIPFLDLGKLNLESLTSYQARPHFKVIIFSLIASQIVFSTNVLYHKSGTWFKNYMASCLSTDQLNGFCLPGFGNNAISKQLGALNEFTPSDSIVLTGFSTAVRIKGFNENFPLFDPMEIVLKKDVRKIVDWIETKGPRFILADGPASSATLVSPEHTEQIWLYLSSLKAYREVKRHSDWVVFERIQNNDEHKELS